MFSHVLVPASSCHSFYIASNVLTCIASSELVPFLLHCLQCSPLYWFQRARAIPSTLPPMFSSVLIPACPCHSFYIASNVLLCIASSEPVPFLLHCLQCSPLYWFQRARAIPSTLPPMFSSVLVPASPCHSFYIASNVLLCIDSSEPVPFLLHCLQCSPLYWFQRARAIPSTLPPMFSSVLVLASPCHSFYIASNVLLYIGSSEPVPFLLYCLQCSPLYWFQRARAIPSTLPPMFSSVLIPACPCHSFYIASNVLLCIGSSEPVPFLLHCLQCSPLYCI